MNEIAPGMFYLGNSKVTVGAAWPVEKVAAALGDRNPAFTRLIDEIKQLHQSKNHDYAHDSDPLSNLRACEAFGVPAWKGVLVRLSDKYARIQQIAGGKTPKHESLRDSLMDQAVYSLLAICLLDEQAVQQTAPTTDNQQ